MSLIKGCFSRHLPINILVFLLCILVAGLLITQFFALSPSNADSTIETPSSALTVTVTHSKLATLDNSISASGAIKAWQEAIIGSQLNGLRLTAVLVDVGDIVKKGQILARFDASTLLNEKALLTANLHQAEAYAEQAELDYKRMQKLIVEGGISKQSLLQAKTNQRTTAAQLETAKAQLASNALQLGYVEVVSPDAGVISSRTATLGAIGSQGQELFRLVRDNRIEWRGELTAAQIKDVAIGQAITLTLSDNSQVQAKIRQIAPTIDEETRMLLIYADIEPGSHAKAGMFVDGRIKLSESQAIMVPAESVVIRDGRSYIFCLKESSSTVISTLVQVGRSQGNNIEINGDPDACDSIVQQGAGFLNDGDSVSIIQTHAQTESNAVMQVGDSL